MIVSIIDNMPAMMPDNSSLLLHTHTHTHAISAMQWTGYCYFMLQVYIDCRNYEQPDSVLRLLTQNWTADLGTHKPVKSVEDT